MNADGRFRAALEALAAALEEIQAPSMIIGGLAVIASGVPRQTIDIDATIRGRDSDLEHVVEVLGRHGITPRIPDAFAFARERQVLLLQHESTGLTLEISFAWLPFEEKALARATLIDLHGVAFRVALPEDLIVYKFAAWRDRDRSDVERLLTVRRRDRRRTRSRAGRTNCVGAGRPGACRGL